jgi:ATP-dependent phosphofructokinase / diphosphate-dependent phosphofructokinase
MQKNVLIAQSGGPTSVINNSLRGIIDQCSSYPNDFNTIYSAWHGIEGLLKEELLNLSAQEHREIELLRTTPGAGFTGTCRYKLKNKHQKDYARVFEVLKAHNIGYLFYIGGNDSMDTALKIHNMAVKIGFELIVTGVPKTIDNDIGDQKFKIIDHTPGYGSVAKYLAYTIQNANEENAGSYPADPVLVIQVMGRNTGFIPAAARLADPNRKMPMQIYMPESGITMELLAENVNSSLKQNNRCIVILSEGFNTGDIGKAEDGFGHIEFGATKTTAQQCVINYLNSKGIRARGLVRGQVPGTDQRVSMVYASDTDLNEAYEVAVKAVEIARTGSSGFMATILRKQNYPYRATYNQVELQLTANSERHFPAEWLAKNKADVTDDFIEYAKPLLGKEWIQIPLENGIQRFSRCKSVFAQQKCSKYIPQDYQKL